MCYHGNGFTFSDIYNMPVHIRLFYYNKLVQAIKNENDRGESYAKTSQPVIPNFNQKASSKVRFGK